MRFKTAPAPAPMSVRTRRSVEARTGARGSTAPCCVGSTAPREARVPSVAVASAVVTSVATSYRLCAAFRLDRRPLKAAASELRAELLVELALAIQLFLPLPLLRDALDLLVGCTQAPLACMPTPRAAAAAPDAGRGASEPAEELIEDSNEQEQDVSAPAVSRVSSVKPVRRDDPDVRRPMLNPSLSGPCGMTASALGRSLDRRAVGNMVTGAWAEGRAATSGAASVVGRAGRLDALEQSLTGIIAASR